MAEYYTSQGDNHLIVEQKYYNMLDIEGFSQMMKDPSYCYKFYWLEAIVHLISENVYQTTFDEIIDEMISNAWYSVREFHIHLSGIQSDGMVRDGLERAVNLLSEYSSLPANASKVEIKNGFLSGNLSLKYLLAISLLCMKKYMKSRNYINSLKLATEIICILYGL